MDKFKIKRTKSTKQKNTPQSQTILSNGPSQQNFYTKHNNFLIFKLSVNMNMDTKLKI